MLTAEMERHSVVEQMIDERKPMKEVEAAIELMAIGEEERDALALWAWAWEETRDPRRGIRSLAKLRELVPA